MIGAYALFSVGGAIPSIASANPGLKNMISGLFGLPFGKTCFMFFMLF